MVSNGFENEAMRKAAETWSGKWWESGGGGTAWDAYAYDPELKLIYVGVGNGTLWNQSLRSPQGGDNLYLSSVVALNSDDGSLEWYYQTTPGDNWDYTATQHMILAEIEFNNQPRDASAQKWFLLCTGSHRWNLNFCRPLCLYQLGKPC
jgi:quinohemoprotein ethanol dehydrogenase